MQAYERCNDANRTYACRQEWIDHENAHRSAWHCEDHMLEFWTEPDYIEHLTTEHETGSFTLAPEMIASVIGPSTRPGRSCPFCKTGFTNVQDMQEHVAGHLERSSLLALPKQAAVSGKASTGTLNLASFPRTDRRLYYLD